MRLHTNRDVLKTETVSDLKSAYRLMGSIADKPTSELGNPNSLEQIAARRRQRNHRAVDLKCDLSETDDPVKIKEIVDELRELTQDSASDLLYVEARYGESIALLESADTEIKLEVIKQENRSDPPEEGMLLVSNIEQNPFFNISKLSGWWLSKWLTTIPRFRGCFYPLLPVRKAGQRYELVVDHSAWTAYKTLGIERVPVAVTKMRDDQMRRAIQWEPKDPTAEELMEAEQEWRELAET